MADIKDFNNQDFEKVFYNIGTKAQDYNSPNPEFAGNAIGKSKFDSNIPFESIDNIDRIRAERQPWYEQSGAMLNQAVVGEIIGGTLMSVGALLEAPEMVYNEFMNKDNEFHNAVFDIGKVMSDWSQEATPIYDTGERFNDPGYWFKNGVSVASSLSMLIPGMAVAKGAQLVGKGMRLGTTASGLLQTGMGALAMRHAENYREASGVYDSIYQQGMQALSEGKLPDMQTEDDVKKAASQAAALDYNSNYINLAFDMIQLGSILKPLGNFTRNVGLLDYKLAKATGRLPTSKLGKAAYWMAEPGKGLLEQSTEGIEEVINTISQFEGEREGKIKLGLTPDDNTTLSDRIGGYLGKEETMDSFIWGVLGGVTFNALGKPVSKALGLQQDNTTERKLSEIANRENTIKQYSQHVNAINTGEVVRDIDGSILADYSQTTDEDKTTLVNDLRSKMAFKLGLDASKAGNVDLLLEQLDDKDFQNTLTGTGLASKETLSQDIKAVKDEVVRAEETYKKHYQRLFEKPIDQDIKNRLLDKAVILDNRRYDTLESIKQLESDYNNLYQKDGFIQSNPDKTSIDLTIYQEGLAVALMDLKEHLQEAEKTGNTYAEEKINRVISNVEKKLKTIGNKAPIDPSYIDRRLGQNMAQQEIHKEWVNIYSEDLSNIDKKESIEKASNEIKDTKNVIKDALSKSQKDNEELAKEERLIKQEETLYPEEVVIEDDFSIELEMQELQKQSKLKETPAEPEIKIATEVNPEARQMLNQLGYKDSQIDELSVDDRKNILTKGIPKEEWDVLSKYKQELKNEDDTKIIPDDNYYDNAKAKVVSSELDNIVDDLKNSNGAKSVDSDGSIVYDNSKIESGHNALGHQDRAYKREEVTVAGIKTVKYTDEDNTLNEEAPLDLLNPDKYKVGEQVEFVVDDTDDIKIYDPSKEGKEVITWGAYKKLLRDRNVDKTSLDSPLLNMNAEQYQRISESERNNYKAHLIGSVIGKLQTVRSFINANEENKEVPSGFDNWTDRAKKILINANKEYNSIVKSYVNSSLHTEDKLISDIDELLKTFNSNISALTGDVVDITKLQDYKNNVPIRMSGINAYLHSDNWISEENVTGNIQDDKLALRKIRNGIIEKGSYKTDITSVSNGVLFLLANNESHSLKEAVGNDSEYIFAVGTNDGLKVGEGKLFEQPVINKKIISGASYIIVKTPAGNNMAISTNSQKIGDSANSDDIKKLIIRAINTFLDNDVTSSKDILKITGFDVTDLNGLENFLKAYLHLYNTNGKMLGEIIKSIPNKTTNMYFSVNKGVIEFFDGDLSRGGGKVYFMSKENQSQREMFLSKLEKSLDGFYLNSNIDYFDRNKNIPIFDGDNLVAKPYREFIMENLKTSVKGNKVGENNGKDVYSYSLQPVYRFNFNEFLAEESVEGEVKKEDTSVKPTVEASKEKVKSRARRRLDALNNWSDLPYTPNTSKVEDLSKEANNSHLKC